MSTPESKVVIIGAGVFGLSAALHLKRRGYQEVTVFDYQPYDQNCYDPANGCDAASADVNKIYRCTYGDWEAYQNLAMRGRPVWCEWNEAIARTPAHDLPKGLTPADRPFVNSGFVQQSLEASSNEHDLRSLQEVRKAGLADHIFVKGNEEDMDKLARKAEREPEQHWMTKLYALSTARRGTLYSFLDTFAGYTRADKACIWARHLCEQAGVKFVLGPNNGKLEELLHAEDDSGSVMGIRTVDGRKHYADLVLIACGGWTPGIVPECEGVLQATAGSVVTIQLPRHRQDLWDKYSPERFPTWTHGMLEGYAPEYSGFYGFPRTPDGVLKIGYRGRKWTNYQSNERIGHRISTPKTKYTPDPASNLPKRALEIIKHAVGELFPDLTEVGITDTRLCWYTDSLDDSFVIDYVPGHNNTLFVASGGSGHGFKFLPVLGEHIVNQMERKVDEFTPLWRWRTVPKGHPANGLEEGEMSGRDLNAIEMGDESHWAWDVRHTHSKLDSVVRARL